MLDNKICSLYYSRRRFHVATLPPSLRPVIGCDTFVPDRLYCSISHSNHFIVLIKTFWKTIHIRACAKRVVVYSYDKEPVGASTVSLFLLCVRYQNKDTALWIWRWSRAIYLLRLRVNDAWQRFIVDKVIDTAYAILYIEAIYLKLGRDVAKWYRQWFTGSEVYLESVVRLQTRHWHE